MTDADPPLHARDVGAGPALVLLHSTAADSRMWDPLLPRLSPRFRLLLPDFRGFGFSALPPEPYVDAADVLELVDRLGIDRFVLVGSSGGGRVALQLATAVPDRVRRLILLCPAADGVEPTAALRDLWSAEARLIDAGDLDGAARLNADRWLGPEASPSARDAVFTMQRQALAVQTRAGEVERGRWPVDLDRLRMPVTVVTGARDLDFFSAVGRHLAARLPDVRLIELSWAGHLPSLERPDVIAELLAAESQTSPEDGH